MDARQAGDGDVRGSDRYRAARLAALVRDRRRAAGLTQGQLAESSGLSRAAIRDLEQGRTHRPRARSLARLAAALGLDAIQAGELAVLARESGRPVAGARGGALPDGAADGLRLQVLGPLLAWRDGVRLPLGGQRRQAVLGLLALAPGSLVHRSAIIDALWPAAPPPTAVSAVQSHISRLRALLEHPPHGDNAPVDDGQPRRDGLLISAGACYCVRTGPGELDLLDFGQLAKDARSARQAGHAAEACELYERALGLWHGEPLAGVDLLAGHPGLAALARQRGETVIEYAQIASSAGWHERVLAPLQALAAAEPLNERAHAQLMIALAGCGQQAEALGLFGDLRARLDAELAMPPGPDLAAAHLRVLRQDIPAPAALTGQQALADPPAGQQTVPADRGAAAPAGSHSGGDGAIPVPRQLPAALPHF